MKRIFLPLFLVAATGIAHAADDIRDKFNPVYTAVISQTIASDARAAALGDIGAATDPDVNSQSWNPQNIPSPSRGPAFLSTIRPGFANSPRA